MRCAGLLRAATLVALPSLVTSATGDVTTVASSFSSPYGVELSLDETKLYVSDSHRIYEVLLATGVKTVLAGSTAASFADGTGTAANFNAPNGLGRSPVHRMARCCTAGRHGSNQQATVRTHNLGAPGISC